MKTSIVMLLCALTMAADARIGDTREQCLERYHDPAIEREGWNVGEYRRGALLTDCAFRKNSCTYIRYSIVAASSVRRPAFKDEPQFSELQVKRLLALNSGASEWIKEGDDHQGPSYHGIYVTKDGKIQAKVIYGMVIVEVVALSAERKSMQKETEIDRIITEIGAEQNPQIATNAGQWAEPEKQKADAKWDQNMKDMKASVKEIDTTLKIAKAIDEASKNVDELKKANEAAAKAALPPGMEKK